MSETGAEGKPLLPFLKKLSISDKIITFAP